jgi:hypothetical protein
MPLSRDLREFIECLNSNEVEYLIVGALAVSWHGFARYSADVDFLIRPSHANAVRVLRALSQFGFGSLDISASDLTFSGKVIQLGPLVARRTASTPRNFGSRNRQPKASRAGSGLQWKLL